MTYPVDWVDNVPTDQEARTKDLHDRGGDVYFIIHHSVTLRVQDTIATFKSDREVSANLAIGPTVAGGDDIKVVLTVPEFRRAWTSASPLDDRALTTEVCDQAMGGNWPISPVAKHKLADIAAYMHREYGMPLDRVHILTHQEVYARGYGSYATACAGPDMQASMDAIVAEARQIVSGSQPAPELEFDMAFLPDIAQNKEPGAKPTPGVAIFSNGHVEPIDRDQWNAYVTFGARVILTKNPGHWDFLMSQAAKLRAASGVK